VKGRQRIVISKGMMPELLRGHEMSSVESNLPLDATLVYVAMDPMTDRVLLVMESAEWPETFEAAPLPDFDLRFSKYETELSRLLKVLDR